MKYLEVFGNTESNDIDDITLFYFIFTVPNFIKNVYTQKRLQLFIKKYEQLNFNSLKDN